MPIIVYVDMVADLFHVGHILFLSQIKNLYPDSKIYVGLMSDQQAHTYKRLPIQNITERAIMVKACRYVDEVFENAPMPITREFIMGHNINQVIHGDDISETSRQYWYREAIAMSIYSEIPYTPNISTSDIIARIKKME